jgi:hypothetical protein
MGFGFGTAVRTRAFMRTADNSNPAAVAAASRVKYGELNMAFLWDAI